MSHTRRVIAGMAAGAVAAATVVAVGPSAAADHRPAVDVAAVQRQLDLLTAEDRMPGALAQVSDRRDRSVTLTSGTAELGTGRPMVGARGRFRIASVTKPFVATVVLQLVAEGKVRLDEPIDTYLPEVVRGSGDGATIDGREITVRQLLQHTSGIPNYTEHIDLGDSTRPPISPEELLGVALVHEPDFPPGQGWHYSNTGYVIAGMLVERVTDRDVITEVTERVIRPLGLHGTYWPAAGDIEIRGPHARNYTENQDVPAGPLVDVTDFEPSLAWAAGAVISTPTDLNRFWHALLNGRLLPRDVMAEMRSTVPLPPQWQEFLGADAGYGLGVMRIPLSCGGFAWGHGGDLEGVSNVSAGAVHGAAATVYRTAQVNAMQPQLRTLETAEIALCTSRNR